MKTFGDELKRLRHQVGWTQMELGKRVGVERETISKLERGETRPRAETLAAIEQVLGLSRQYAHALLDGSALDVRAELERIAVLPTREERFDAREALPPAIQAVIDQAVQDEIDALKRRRPARDRPPNEDQA